MDMWIIIVVIIVLIFGFIIGIMVYNDDGTLDVKKCKKCNGDLNYKDGYYICSKCGDKEKHNINMDY